jgi:4-alpha-glucanotransferase
LGERRRGDLSSGIHPVEWGIAPGYEDVDQRWRPPPQATVDAVLAAMGATPQGPPPAGAVTIRLDQPAFLPSGQLTLEDGTTLPVGGPPPDGLPPGYHRLHPDDGPVVTLIASPGRCPLPAAPTWGFSAQLYATRSRRSWGIGDLADLDRLSDWSKGLGAGFVLVNPLHAVSPTQPQQSSPYFPGSRCFLNPLYLVVEAVPGLRSRPGIAELARAGQALNDARLIDRDQVWQLKSRALEAGFADFAGDPAFDAYLTERGDALLGFATFCALAERYGSSWDSWPSGWRDRTSASVQQFAASRVGSVRIRYYAWLQWHLDRQLAAAGALPVVTDLAVGVDPGGPDAWLWPGAFAEAMRIGAPPDRFNTRGQDWALLPFDPWGLRAGGYAPWIESLRGVMRHGGGLRLDHVMGLFRLYWIPRGATPKDGAYVRYPADDLLNIVALEAHQAGAWVVGEDLGTVEEEVRVTLAGRNVLSYKVWWFEADPPSAWPAQAFGALSTHDLPTVAGVASGGDLAAQRRLHLEPDEEAAAELRARLMSRTGSDQATPGPEIVARAYADLASAPCLLLAASLDDALALEERPNMPATIDEWPNWRLGLPVPLEEVEQMTLPRRIAASLSRPALSGGPTAMPPEAGGGP